MLFLSRERERHIDRESVRERERERESESGREPGVRDKERSRCVNIKNIKKQNLLYGCFKKNPHKR